MARKRRPSANRTDMLTPKVSVPNTPTGLPYGEAQQLQRAQSAVPAQAPGLPAPTMLPPGAAPPVHPDIAAQDAAQQTPPPTSPITASTDRPNEPVTAGLNQHGPMPDPTLSILQGVYARYPSPSILALINEARAQNPNQR